MDFHVHLLQLCVGERVCGYRWVCVWVGECVGEGGYNVWIGRESRHAIKELLFLILKVRYPV